MDRRGFIKTGSLTAAGISILPSGSLFAKDKKRIDVGFIGVGGRGRGHVRTALGRDDVNVVAVCDIQEDSLAKCRKLFQDANKPLPREYAEGGIDAYKKMLEKEKLDAVIIATPWQFHHSQSIDSMEAGIYVGCEVIAGLTLDEHWDLVNTSEKTGVPYMCLENVAYRRDVMAVLNMVRQGLFGEIIHVEGGYQHDLREVLFNNPKNPGNKGVEFGEKAYGEAQWRTQFNIDLDGDLYPTHGLGPVMHFANINHGNRITKVVSFSSKARGLAAHIERESPGHPNAKINYKDGDVTTSLMSCANGETLEITHDVHLPRPYSIGLRVQGTNGIWMDVNDGIYIEGKAAKTHEWDKASEWIKKYDHPLWAKYANEASGSGHGGMDWYVDNAFYESVKQQRQTPIDVYDSVTMSALFPLSIQSIKEGNKTLEYPDFTRGKWKNRKPVFALDDSGF